jgi:GTP cyclohydrolase I
MAIDTGYAGAAIGEYVVSHRAVIDLEKATAAAREFLVSLGVDLDAEALHRTPYRMAKAYSEILTPAPFTLTTFENDGRYQELLLVRSIAFSSICEHHLLPFAGTADVGYLPGGRIAGLSKLAHAVRHLARRPHVQERLTEEIASWLHDRLEARGVGVLIRAEHTCMTSRGVNAVGARTVSQAYTGLLRESSEERSAFRALCLSAA